PLLNDVLRAYDLGPGDTVYMDNGVYQQFENVVLSGNTAFNDDEGLTITGLTTAGSSATISPLGWSTGPAIDINQGDFTTITHLSLTGPTDYGVFVHNGSTNNSLSYLTQSGAVQDGIDADA